jgi:hypothetical protein
VPSSASGHAQSPRSSRLATPLLVPTTPVSPAPLAVPNAVDTPPAAGPVRIDWTRPPSTFDSPRLAHIIAGLSLSPRAPAYRQRRSSQSSRPTTPSADPAVDESAAIDAETDRPLTSALSIHSIVPLPRPGTGMSASPTTPRPGTTMSGWTVDSSGAAVPRAMTPRSARQHEQLEAFIRARTPDPLRPLPTPLSTHLPQTLVIDSAASLSSPREPAQESARRSPDRNATAFPPLMRSAILRPLTSVRPWNSPVRDHEAMRVPEVRRAEPLGDGVNRWL